MIAAQKILLLTGTLLIAITMLYGVGYAIWDEHQTLQGMGILLATGFMEAAGGNMQASFEALEAYGALRKEYGFEIHSHGHWGMLSLILIILGLVFKRMGLSESAGLKLAWLLALSAALFPLGVVMQIGPAAAIGKILSTAGSLGMIAGLFIAAFRLVREPAEQGQVVG